MADCVFCGIARGSIPADIAYQDGEVVAFRDLDPQAPVHVLVIPREHVESIVELADHPELLAALFTAANRLAVDLGVQGSGYRLVFNYGPDAGHSVFHAHLHLLGGRPLAWPPG